MISIKIKNLIIVAVIVIIGVFYILTIREGHDWGDDFSMYIHHAKNIAEGVNFKNTGYIYNRFNPHIGPKTYPPIFPLLLLPVYKLYGLNLTVMKIEIILSFFLFLLTVFLIFKNEFTFKYLVTMIAIIGFNPSFWDFKDYVGSDFSFLSFLFLTFLFLYNVHESNRLDRDRRVYAVIAGLFMYLSYGTRSIGIVLPMCLFIYDIIKYKKVTQFSIIAVSIFIFLMTLQIIFLHSDVGYFYILKDVNKTIANNLVSYIKSLCAIWDNGYSKIFRYILFMIICVLSFIGYLMRIREKITIFEIFGILYLSFINLTYGGVRYLIPIIPLYIFYSFIGIKCITFQRKEIERLVFFMFVSAIFLSYVGKYTKIDYGPIIQGVEKKETIQLFDYIKKNTDKKAVFIFQKPRALALYTGRRSSVYYCPPDDRDLWKYFEEIDAAYLIIGKPFDIDRKYLHSFVEKYKDNFQEVYCNSDFRVYNIKKFL